MDINLDTNTNTNTNKNQNNNQTQNKKVTPMSLKNEKLKKQYLLYIFIFLIFYSLFITIYTLSKPNIEQQVMNLYNENKRTYNSIKLINDIVNWKIK